MIDIFSCVKPKIKSNDRDHVLDAYILAYSDAINSLKKKATTLDLHKIDWLYHAMQEMRLCKTLDKVELAQRIMELTNIVTKSDDADDKALASVSLRAISEAGKHIRRTT